MFSKKRAGTALALATGAALILAGCAGGGGGEAPDAAPTFDPDEEVTLDLAFWGNDVRADALQRGHRGVQRGVPEHHGELARSSAFPEFWEKRQTEAAGGGLPDVMQFDYSYLRQYSENGLLLDLDPYLGNIIETEPLPENILDIGVVNDTTYGIPTSTNAWGMYTNPVLLEQAGVEEFSGGSWEDYVDWMGEVTDGSGGAFYGGTDYTGRIQNFEIQLRSEGSYLFSDEGEPGFDEARLTEFWESGADARDGIVIPQQRLEEVFPLSGFDTANTASELTWDNFGGGLSRQPR